MFPAMRIDEKELVRIDPGYRQVSPTARLDSFLTEGAYSFVELNGESPAGIAFADSATEIFSQLPVMRKFAERYQVVGLEGRSKMLNVLISCWDEFCGGRAERKPVIAIDVLKGNIGITVLPDQVAVPNAHEVFDASGALLDEKRRALVEALGAGVANMIRKLNA